VFEQQLVSAAFYLRQRECHFSHMFFIKSKFKNATKYPFPLSNLFIGRVLPPISSVLRWWPFLVK